MDSVYIHYRKEEQQFAREIAKFVDICRQKYIVKCTDFLDPYRQTIVKNICNQFDDLQCCFYGAFLEPERKRAMIMPADFECDWDEFHVATLAIHVKGTQKALRHGDYLGAILGQGIKREKLGDVVIVDDVCYVALDAKIAEYIAIHLNQVNRYTADVEFLSKDRIPQFEHQFSLVENTVSSLRLDSIIKLAYNLSRGKAAEHIKKGLVKHNWGVCEDIDQAVRPGDIISMKGATRIKILEVAAPNKKGRIPVKIGKYV